ncbi:MAG: hypothetical protein J7J57_01795 [Caldisericaceae bacterium]|nr:hypothetical protein [Caldisericaceae bacterium]
MKKIVAAFGVDNDGNLIDAHFGDSEYFEIFSISENSIVFVEQRKNLKIVEKMHGDPNKAKAISTLLSGVDVLVAFRMGPNILRMKKKFVPVIVGTRDKHLAKKLVLKNFPYILEEIEKEGEKNYITIKNKEE